MIADLTFSKSEINKSEIIKSEIIKSQISDPSRFMDPHINHFQLKAFFTIPFILVELENDINRPAGFKE